LKVEVSTLDPVPWTLSGRMPLRGAAAERRGAHRRIPQRR